MVGLARFLTEARLSELIAGEHAYSYCENNPPIYVDPSGEFTQKGQGLHGLPKGAYDCKGADKPCLDKVYERYPGRHGCLDKNKTWEQTMIGCACENGVNPLFLLAIAFCESHWGTDPTKDPANQGIPCANPYGTHMNPKSDDIHQLCLPGGRLPTFRESSCRTASNVATSGLRGYNSRKCVLQQFETWSKLCANK